MYLRYDKQHCHFCSVLWAAFSSPRSKDTFLSGHPLSEVLAGAECVAHVPLAEFLKTEARKKHPEHVIENVLVNILPDAHATNTVVAQLDYPPLGGSRWYQEVQLLLIHRPSVYGHPGLGRIFDSDWLDTDFIKDRKELCIASHGSDCNSPLKVAPCIPAWLIDIREQCVVPGHKGGPYVALSYQWGKSAPVIRQSSDMQRLQTPGALSSEAISELLPAIIRHVSSLVEAIGERYLWIDALCIDHSDTEGTSNQLRLMGSIYSSAVLTIIASNTNAQNGIKGLRGVSDPRQLPGGSQTLIPWGSETITTLTNVAPYQFVERVTSHPYWRRGWCYQEYALSPRKVILTDQGQIWSCNTGIFNEDLQVHARPEKLGQFQLSWKLNGIPDINRLNIMLADYSQRDLTFEDDALAGITGLLAVLNRSYPGGFLYGLPVMFFDGALCWTAKKSLRRRVTPENHRKQAPPNSALPSWSWIGWKGKFHFDASDDPILDHDQGFEGWKDRMQDPEWHSADSAIWESSPITEWYTSNSSTTPADQRIKIDPSWYTDRTKYRNPGSDLMSGWKRHNFDDLTFEQLTHLALPEGCDRFFYVHANYPHKRFFYPIPIPDLGELAPPTTIPQTAYLFCETQSTNLWACIAEERSVSDVNQYVIGNVLLRDEFGKRVGRLFPHSEKELLNMPKESDNISLDEPLQIVAVCQLRGKTATSWQPPRAYMCEDYIGVLWVLKRDGVFCRRASGRVKKTEWERLNRKDVSLVLG